MFVPSATKHFSLLGPFIIYIAGRKLVRDQHSSLLRPTERQKNGLKTTWRVPPANFFFYSSTH